MQKSASGDNNFDEAREGQGGDRAHVIGDADNVQKTSYVVGRGTDPGAAGPDGHHPGGDGPPRGAQDHGYTAAVRSGGGMNVGLWIVALLAVVIALVYGFGIFT
jgi:hypothetical protein